MKVWYLITSPVSNELETETRSYQLLKVESFKKKWWTSYCTTGTKIVAFTVNCSLQEQMVKQGMLVVPIGMSIVCCELDYQTLH